MMEFKPVPSAIEIINFPLLEDNIIENNDQFLPNNVRCLIVGPSNIGKTNVLLSLLVSKNGLRFKNLYLYSKTLFQKKYKFLENVIKGIKGMDFQTFNNNEEIFDPDDIECDSVLIMDDVSLENQDILRKYFTICRHKKVHLFYLAHTYSLINKRPIRDNANVVCIFPMDLINLKHVWSDRVHTDMSFSKFQDLCAKVWADKYGFLCIHSEKKMHEGKYCKNFQEQINFIQ